MVRVSSPDGRTALRDVVRHPAVAAVHWERGRILPGSSVPNCACRVTVELPVENLIQAILLIALTELLWKKPNEGGKDGFSSPTATSDGFTVTIYSLFIWQPS